MLSRTSWPVGVPPHDCIVIRRGSRFLKICHPAWAAACFVPQLGLPVVDADLGMRPQLDPHCPVDCCNSCKLTRNIQILLFYFCFSEKASMRGLAHRLLLVGLFASPQLHHRKDTTTAVSGTVARQAFFSSISSKPESIADREPNQIRPHRRLRSRWCWDPTQ